MGALGLIDDEASGRDSSTELRRCPVMGFGVNALVLMLEDAGSSQTAARRTMDQYGLSKNDCIQMYTN